MKNIWIGFISFVGLIGWSLITSLQAADISVDDEPLQNLNYSYLYYENGFPTTYNHRRPQSEANLAARANPDLVFQTGYYSLMLDCDDMQLKGYDALTGSDYRTALDKDVSVFTPATSFLLRVQQGGVFYTCTSAVVQDSSGRNVRLVESGQYVKRIDHLGLVFKDSGGNTMVADSDCRLEMSAWPDRVTFFLDFSSETINPITRTTIQVVSPDGITHLKDLSGNQARLTIKPQDDVTLSALNVNDTILEATNLQDGSALNVTFDEDVHAFHIDVPANVISYPADIDRVDEYLIEVTNSSAVAENIPLVFEQPSVRAITGTVMLLCDAEDGRPLGIPVQISKNWHSDGSPHSGSWLRGSTMLTLQPGESRRFKLRVIYGYWGGAGAISHAQLSLIGWGGNWKWDESALGAWGESFTYDPTMHVARAFMADIRPTFTTSLGGEQHHWTENVGGGDFLIYRDSANNNQNLKRQKTCYLQTGPNLTKVLYTGVSDDDKIRATYTSLGVSTLDYHRRFHHYKYEFLQDVLAPQRLVFHQMAAEGYFKTSFADYYIGDETGVSVSGTIEAGGNVYKGSPISFDGKWLSIDDTWTSANRGKPVWAMRGMIALSSTLNGSAFPLYMHKYGRTWGNGNTMLFDFSSDSVTRSYSAGDVVEGEYEFIMPPQHVDNYWGSDAELISRLTAYGDTAWEPVRDEFVHNVLVDVVVQQGTLLNHYPLEIQPTSSSILADFTVTSGGLGHLPVVLKGAASDLELTAQRWDNGVWADLEGVDIHANSYYQGVLNADGTMDYTFSIPRPSLDLDEAWRVRIVSLQNHNRKPVATGKSVWLNEDGSLAIRLDASDADGDSLYIWLPQQYLPNHGTVTQVGRVVTYTPDANYNGSDSFAFRASDTLGGKSEYATISITVNPVNDAPVVTGKSVSLNEDGSLVIALDAFDADGDSLYTWLPQLYSPNHGTVSKVGNVATYTPNANYNGSDSFVFRARDTAGGKSGYATISITVKSVNDKSIANSASKSVNEDSSVAVRLRGSDVDGDSLSFAVQTQPSNGSLSGTVPNLTYTPNAHFNGSDSFTFKVNNSANATVFIRVNPVNDAPVANSDSVVVDQNSSLALTLSGSDLEGSSLTYTVVAQPANGVLSGTAPNLTYTPYAGYDGLDSFTFNVNDGTVNSANASVSITVNELYIDNLNTGLTYVGTWYYVRAAADYKASMTWSSTAGDYVEYTFEGTYIKVGARFHKRAGICNVYIDGVLVAENVDTYSATPINQVVIYEGPLRAKTHTVRLEATGKKNRSALGARIMFDFFCIDNRADDVGVEYMAAAFDVESHPADDFNVSAVGDHIGHIKNRNWAMYEDFDFGVDGVTSFEIMGATPKADANRMVELRIDSPTGTLIGEVEINQTGSWRVYQPCETNITNTVSGVHDLYLVFVTGAFNVQEFHFTRDLDIELGAVSYNDESNPGNNARIRAAGGSVTYVKDGTWVVYEDFDFEEGVASVDMKASSGTAGGTIELRLGSETGTLLGSVSVTGTGGWANYQTFSSRPLRSVDGVHDLYLLFTDASTGYLFNLESFIFTTKKY